MILANGRETEEMAEEERHWFDLGLFGAGFVTGLSDKYTAKRVQAKLVALVFWQGEIRERVARIAEGHGQIADLDEIALLLRTTQDETEEAFGWLRNRRSKIARAFGADVAQKIDYVTYKKMGPGQVRAQLRDMVADKSLDTDRARYVLGQMDEFNALLKKVQTP